MSSAIDNWFGETYQQSRARFLNAARSDSRTVETHHHPLGADGSLAMDVVRYGKEDAACVLVLTSGVHGPELMCGSGCQVGMMKEGRFQQLPDDLAVVLIHGVNPWGAECLRRNTEDNVDLCRNFIDFDIPRPTNPGYEQLHPLLQQPLAAMLPALKEVRRQMGFATFMKALMGGQYHHPDGFGFGGHTAGWSHRVLLDVLVRHTARALHVCIIDYHSGIGPYGSGTAVCMHEDAGLERARNWFGKNIHAPRVTPDSGPEGMGDVKGHCSDGYERALAHSQVTAIVLEFGTYSPQRGLQILLEEHATHRTGRGLSAQLAERMLRYHLPDDGTWRRQIWERANQVVGQAMAGLRGESG